MRISNLVRGAAAAAVLAVVSATAGWAQSPAEFYKGKVIWAERATASSSYGSGNTPAFLSF